MSTSKTNIATLPDELLHKIFALSSDSLPALTQVLCSVSQRWRGVALAYSDLWRVISCNVNDLFPPTQLLELWIERSRHALLDISFESSWSSPEKTGERREQQGYTRRTLDMLLLHRNRWEKLVLSIPIEHAVELKIAEVIIDGQGNPLTDIIATVPSLKSFRWQPLELPGLDVHLEKDFPWETLLRVTLSCQQPWEETSQVVSRCTSATVMILYVPVPATITKYPEHIHLPNLRTLHITGCDRQLPLIANLSSPRLSILHVDIESGKGGTSTAIHQLYAFIRSAKHNLRMLEVEVRNQWLTKEDARTVLQACRELNIPSVDIYVHFDMWVRFDGSVDYSSLRDEFRGMRIAASTDRAVIFGWLDLHAIDNFISEFTKIPDVDMVEVYPDFGLACPETTDEAIKMKVMYTLGPSPRGL